MAFFRAKHLEDFPKHLILGVECGGNVLLLMKAILPL